MYERKVIASYRGHTVLIVDGWQAEQSRRWNVMIESADGSRIFVNDSHVDGVISYCRTNWTNIRLPSADSIITFHLRDCSACQPSTITTV